MLCGDRDETVNPVIGECSKVAQKEYKTRQDWRGKGDPLGIVQKIRICSCWQTANTQTGICLRKRDA